MVRELPHERPLSALVLLLCAQNDFDDENEAADSYIIRAVANDVSVFFCSINLRRV